MLDFCRCKQAARWRWRWRLRRRRRRWRTRTRRRLDVVSRAVFVRGGRECGGAGSEMVVGVRRMGVRRKYTSGGGRRGAGEEREFSNEKAWQGEQRRHGGLGG